MAENSKIAWTTHTFNVWIGCTRVSEGCRFCYAEKWDHQHLAGANWGPGAPRKPMSEGYWKQPAKWNKEAEKTGERPRIFCSSLADVFDEEGLADQRARLWRTIVATPNLDWLLLTKRPENVASMLPDDWNEGYDNVWIGVTTENQISADKRIPILSDLKAKVKFLSIEPQLEKIDFSKWMDKKRFDWMIFGGESGSKREFNPEWIRESMEQAGKIGIARFVKQMGSVWAENNNSASRKGEDVSEWAEEFRVREFPKFSSCNSGIAAV